MPSADIPGQKSTSESVSMIHVWKHHECHAFIRHVGQDRLFYFYAYTISVWLYESFCLTNGSEIPICTRFPQKAAQF